MNFKCQVYNANVYRVIRGSHRFFLQYPWKRAVRITEKPYTPRRKILCMLQGNPVIFTDCRETLQLSWGFPTICIYYRDSLQLVEYFPLKIWGVSHELYSLFLQILQKKPYLDCKHFTGFLCYIGKNLQLLRGKLVKVIGKPHNLFREHL